MTKRTYYQGCMYTVVEVAQMQIRGRVTSTKAQFRYGSYKSEDTAISYKQAYLSFEIHQKHAKNVKSQCSPLHTIFDITPYLHSILSLGDTPRFILKIHPAMQTHSYGRGVFPRI